MSVKKKKNVYQLKLTYTCECGNVNEVEVSPDDFCTTSDNCDLCGSPGSLSIDVFCPCGKYKEIFIKDW